MRIGAVILLLSCMPAAAQQRPGLATSPTTAPASTPIKMEVVDFVVDASDLKGKKVTLIECRFGGTNSSWVFCRAPSGASVSVSIETKSLSKEDFRRALKECHAHDGPERCTGSVTGTADIFMGPSLKNAKIEWSQP